MLSSKLTYSARFMSIIRKLLLRLLSILIKISNSLFMIKYMSRMSPINCLCLPIKIESLSTHLLINLKHLKKIPKLLRKEKSDLHQSIYMWAFFQWEAAWQKLLLGFQTNTLKMKELVRKVCFQVHLWWKKRSWGLFCMRISKNKSKIAKKMQEHLLTLKKILLN